MTLPFFGMEIAGFEIVDFDGLGSGVDAEMVDFASERDTFKNEVL